MTWKTRLANGFNTIANSIAPLPPPRSSKPHIPSVPLNQLRTSWSYPLSEVSPGLSQPVFGPEITTVGAYSREGYTSRQFDIPDVDFRKQSIALQEDEDVQLAINHLSSKVTGGEHFIKTVAEQFTNHFNRLTRDLNFDTFDTILVKELLWHGNSVWKPRMGIRNIRRAEDLMHIPISSFVRVWWDRQRIPYKYEFRGAEYQGYHNPGEVIPFIWNPINASAFGTGFGVAMLAERLFEQILPEGRVPYRLPNMLARKLATFFNMQLAEQRYISKNIYQIESGEEEDRQSLEQQLNNTAPGQDIVAGTGVKVNELGTSARNFNPQQFMDITQGPIFKALNDFRGKQAGTSQHTYANAKTAALLDEIGLSAFPIAVREQLEDMLFKPWYESNPLYDPGYAGGLVPIPWEDLDFTLNFGEVEKKDIPIEEQIKLIDVAISSGAVSDPLEIRQLLEDAGLGLRKEMTQQMDQMYNDPQGMQALNQIANYGNPNPPYADMGGGEVNPYEQIMGYPNFNNQNVGSPPMDNPIYDSMARDIRPELKKEGDPFLSNRSTAQPSRKSQSWNIGRDYE